MQELSLTKPAANANESLKVYKIPLYDIETRLNSTQSIMHCMMYVYGRLVNKLRNLVE